MVTWGSVAFHILEELLQGLATNGVLHFLRTPELDLYPFHTYMHVPLAAAGSRARQFTTPWSDTIKMWSISGIIPWVCDLVMSECRHLPSGVWLCNVMCCMVQIVPLAMSPRTWSVTTLCQVKYHVESDSANWFTAQCWTLQCRPHGGMILKISCHVL